MATIHVVGHVASDFVPKQSNRGTSYLQFGFIENLGRGERARTQYFQVWAWEQTAKDLMESSVKKGSFLWLTGSLELVDCTAQRGELPAVRMKVCLTDWGFQASRTKSKPDNDPIAAHVGHTLSIEVLDGDRVPLPE